MEVVTISAGGDLLSQVDPYIRHRANLEASTQSRSRKGAHFFSNKVENISPGGGGGGARGAPASCAPALDIEQTLKQTQLRGSRV